MDINNLKTLVKKTPNILNWVVSIFSLLIGSDLIKTEAVAGLCAITIGFILLPPFMDILKEELRIAPSKNIKTLVLLVLAILMFSALHSSTNYGDSPTTTVQPRENKVGNQGTAGTREDTLLEEELYKVIKVIDGDTIALENGMKVRYIGIDTPETVNPNTEIECFGKEASNKNKELVEGKMIKLEKDISETDRYGRLLRYVYVDSIFVNDILVREGYANASTYPPDVKYQEQFIQAEKEAKDNNKGLWNSCVEKNTPQQTSTPPAPTVTTTKTVTSSSIQNNTISTSNYTCNCSKTCPQLNCEEAQYQLNNCGCSARDGDNDGVACDTHCQ